MRQFLNFLNRVSITFKTAITRFSILVMFLLFFVETGYSQKCNQTEEFSVRHGITYDFWDVFMNNSNYTIMIQTWEVTSPIPKGAYKYVGPWDFTSHKSNRIVEAIGMTVSSKDDFNIKYTYTFKVPDSDKVFTYVSCAEYNVTYCGDGRRDVPGIGDTWKGEECDDGNKLDNDGCDCDCTKSKVVAEQKEIVKNNRDEIFRFPEEQDPHYSDYRGGLDAENIIVGSTLLGIGALLYNWFSSDGGSSSSNSPSSSYNSSSSSSSSTASSSDCVVVIDDKGWINGGQTLFSNLNNNDRKKIEFEFQNISNPAVGDAQISYVYYQKHIIIDDVSWSRRTPTNVFNSESSAIAWLSNDFKSTHCK